jgi:hypothetical protein
MKARKAVKRLNKVESLLSNIMDNLTENSDGVGDLLASAKESVLRAKRELDSKVVIAASKKPAAKANTLRRRRLSAEGRKRISLAAKKRWATARRKGINAVTGERLKKSA